MDQLASQEKPGVEMGFSSEGLWRTLLCNGIIPLTATEHQHGFENVVSADMLPAWTEEGREGAKWRKAVRLLGFHMWGVD